MNSYHNILTIAVPCHNESQFLHETLLSVKSQTFMDFAVEIYDNNSTDVSLDIAKRFSHQDKRFRFHKNSSNIGLLNNFRNALNNSDSKYFMWMGAHDMIESNYLFELINELEKNSTAALSFPNIKYLDTNGKIYSDTLLEKEKYLLSPVKNYLNSIGEGRKATARMHGVFKRECIKDIGRFQWNFGGMDHIFLSRSEFYGTVHNTNTSYIRRMWSDTKLENHKGIGASTRYFMKSNKQYGLKKLTFIPLYEAYINDFFRLPLKIITKIKYFPQLTYLITKKFEVNLFNNLILYVWNSLFFIAKKYLKVKS